MTIDVDVLDNLLKEVEALASRARNAIEAGKIFDDLPDLIVEALEKAAKIKAAFTLEIESSQGSIDRLTTQIEKSLVYEKINKHKEVIEALNEADRQLNQVVSDAGRMLIDLEAVIAVTEREEKDDIEHRFKEAGWRPDEKVVGDIT